MKHTNKESPEWLIMIIMKKKKKLEKIKAKSSRKQSNQLARNTHTQKEIQMEKSKGKKLSEK